MDGRGARRLIGDVVCTDDDLAVGDLAKGPRILPGNADRAAPLLGQSGVVQHQQALRWTLGHQGLHALPVKGLGLPGRVGQRRCCKRSVEVAATAAAMVSQFFRGRSVNRPVR